MRLTPATNEAIRYACLHYHYAKAVPVNTVAYNVYNDSDEWCGVILFARGANDRIGSEYGLLQGQILELVRVALNGKQESTSQAVAMCLKQLRKDCPLCRMVVSYADCDQNHLGTIYQATNWIYVGTSMENQQDSSWIVNGKRRHGRIISGWVKQRGGLNGLTREQFIRKYYDPNATKYITKGKRKYLFPFDKQMKRKVEPLRKPYPKEAGWVKPDRESYKKGHSNDE
ncbi:MAG: protein Mom [Bacteroidaceae bacterium]|jgi:hypothetical protein|nr:protein Mom [Bacteroidaceae bacterium]